MVSFNYSRGVVWKKIIIKKVLEGNENIITNSQNNETEIIDEINESNVQIENIDDSNVTTSINEIKTNETKFEEVEIPVSKKEIRTDSYFDGTLLELIGWNLLNFLITIVTLGIANPWGECMLIRFKTNHTILNGKRLKFNGNGGDYFVEKFKWIFLTIVTLGIYSFWIPIKKTKWIIGNISFEDEEFIKGESYFDGKLIHLIGVNLLCNFLNILSFGLLYFFTMCFKQKWLAKHSIINRKKIIFDGSAMSLFGHYLLWIFLTIITFGIFGLWFNIKLIKWQVKNSRIKLAGEEPKKENPIAIIIIAVISISLSLTILLMLILPNINSNELPDLSSPFGSGNSIETSPGLQANRYYN